MHTPVRITFRDMKPSSAVTANIQDRVAKLERVSDRMMACKVLVESPHNQHQQARLFHVRVEVAVPGRDVVIARARAEQDSHADVYVAIRDAFRAARRVLTSSRV